MSSGLNRSGLTRPSGSLKSNERPETSPQHGKSFAENLDILFNELVLATQWGRPSVLLAVNKSKFGQEKAEKALEARLKKQGLEIARIVVNDQRPDVPALIKQAGGKPVFFISNLDWGGGDQGMQAYRALNMQRELFVEDRDQGGAVAHHGGSHQSCPPRAGLLGLPPSRGRIRQPAKSCGHQVACRRPALGHADDGGNLR